MKPKISGLRFSTICFGLEADGRAGNQGVLSSQGPKVESRFSRRTGDKKDKVEYVMERRGSRQGRTGPDDANNNSVTNPAEAIDVDAFDVDADDDMAIDVDAHDCDADDVASVTTVGVARFHGSNDQAAALGSEDGCSEKTMCWVGCPGKCMCTRSTKSEK